MRIGTLAAVICAILAGLGGSLYTGSVTGNSVVPAPNRPVQPSATPGGTNEHTFTLVEVWGSRGEGEGEFLEPWGVTIGDDGYIYIADTGNHRIQKFDAEGHFIIMWGSEGSGNGQFNRPYDLHVLDGFVYVTDSFNHRIQKFTSEGQFVDAWDMGILVYGITAGAAGDLYVVKYDSSAVLKLDTEGHILDEWERLDEGPGRFTGPFGIAIHPAGYVYVTQRLPYRVVKFDLAGNLITWWERDEVITAASGIAITARDEVIVADHFGGQMQTYNLDGELLATWAVGELWDPGVVEVDRNDRVYVADVGHSAIKIYERVRPTPTPTPTATATVTLTPTPTGTLEAGEEWKIYLPLVRKGDNR